LPHPAVLVGKKVDLPRRVARRAAERFAAERGMPYVETSAITGEGVEEAFLTLIERIEKEGAGGISTS